MILFALTIVFLLSFALPPGAGRAPIPPPAAGAVSVREIAGIFIWIGLLFAAVIGFGSSASVDREGSRIEGLLLAPVDPAALFAGKALANLAFLSLLELFVFPIFMLLVDIPPGNLLPEILLVAAAANVGLVSVGTLFGAASQQSRARLLVLPLITFPVVLPGILAASRLTSSLLTTGALAGQGRWLALLVIYDVIFLAIGSVTFEFVIQE